MPAPSCSTPATCPALCSQRSLPPARAEAVLHVISELCVLMEVHRQSNTQRIRMPLGAFCPSEHSCQASTRLRSRTSLHTSPWPPFQSQPPSRRSFFCHHEFFSVCLGVVFFFGLSRSMQKFQGQESNQSRSSDPAGSLTARPPGNSLIVFLILIEMV